MAKPGPKPGQLHSGQFKKGHDSRRMTPSVHAASVEFKEACRSKSPEALAYLYSVLTDDEEQTANRMASAKYIIEHAHGKAVTPIATDGEQGKITGLTMGQIDSMIAGYLANEREIQGEVLENAPEGPVSDDKG